MMAYQSPDCCSPDDKPRPLPFELAPVAFPATEKSFTYLLSSHPVEKDVSEIFAERCRG